MNKYILIILALACSYIANATTDTTDTIMFDHESVIAIKDDTILYNNPDQFDYDNLAYLAGYDKWYGRYIKIVIPKGVLYDNKNDYAIITTNQYTFKLTYLKK